MKLIYGTFWNSYWIIYVKCNFLGDFPACFTSVYHIFTSWVVLSKKIWHSKEAQANVSFKKTKCAKFKIVFKSVEVFKQQNRVAEVDILNMSCCTLWSTCVLATSIFSPKVIKCCKFQTKISNMISILCKKRSNFNWDFSFLISVVMSLECIGTNLSLWVGKSLVFWKYRYISIKSIDLRT